MHFLRRSAQSAPAGRLRIWYSRAAVAELKAALETVNDSFPDRATIKVWERSSERAELGSDHLLKCLGKIRDLVLHTAKPILNSKAFAFYLVTSSGTTTQQTTEIFVSPITPDAETTRSAISLIEIAWFNRQANMWPLKELVVESWWRLACVMNRFELTARRSGLTLPHSTGTPSKRAIARSPGAR